jgi:transcriptional regulator with XRE-family HTH domain
MEKERLKGLNLNQLAVGLRALRLSHGMSISDLAEESGSALAYLSRVETGVVVPKISTLSDILAVYNVTIKEFYVWCDSNAHLL